MNKYKVVFSENDERSISDFIRLVRDYNGYDDDMAEHTFFHRKTALIMEENEFGEYDGVAYVIFADRRAKLCLPCFFQIQCIGDGLIGHPEGTLSTMYAKVLNEHKELFNILWMLEFQLIETVPVPHEFLTIDNENDVYYTCKSRGRHFGKTDEDARKYAAEHKTGEIPITDE